MGEGVSINPGSIGASNPELSRYILDCQELMDSIMFRLQGNVLLKNPDGSSRIVHLEDRKYSNEAIAWMRGKIEENLNKVVFLSTYQTTGEMLREGYFIRQGFRTELWYFWKEFKLSNEQYKELNELHRNFVCVAIRIPLFSGHKNFLRDTTNQSTSIVTQNLNDNQNRGGFLGGLGLGRR